MNPQDVKYSKEHEWAKDGGGGVYAVGITLFAQEQLGDIVYLDLPAPGARVQQFKKFGEIESVKTVSDLFSPLTGEVVARNQDAMDKPELVNQDPYSVGWLIKVKGSNPKELDSLLTARDYEAFLATQKKK